MAAALTGEGHLPVPTGLEPCHSKAVAIKGRVRLYGYDYLSRFMTGPTWEAILRVAERAAGGLDSSHAYVCVPSRVCACANSRRELRPSGRYRHSASVVGGRGHPHHAHMGTFGESFGLLVRRGVCLTSRLRHAYGSPSVQGFPQLHERRR